MRIRAAAALLFFLACLSYLAAPLMAQMQIGGGTCSSASLNGTYSATLTGRDVSSTLTFSKALEGIGTATFDGQSKVAFTLTNNTNQSSGMSQTWSGTYSLQANCTGTLTLTSRGNGELFSGVLQRRQGLSDNRPGRHLHFYGQRQPYAGGSMQREPADRELLLQRFGIRFDVGRHLRRQQHFRTASVRRQERRYRELDVAASGTSTTTNATGQYSVSPSCVGSATVTDSSGNVTTLQFIVTTSSGSNFLVTGRQARL